VLITPKPKDTNVEVSVNILLGMKHESHKEVQMTHFSEHLLSYFVSEKHPDYKTILATLNRMGAKYNASTTEYETKFYIRGHYKHLPYFLDVLSNAFKVSALQAVRPVEQERNAVIQELRQPMNLNIKFLNICTQNMPISMTIRRTSNN
jgi:secreted Zn-dependent insulinase-like peptidase